MDTSGFYDSLITCRWLGALPAGHPLRTNFSASSSFIAACRVRTARPTSCCLTLANTVLVINHYDKPADHEAHRNRHGTASPATRHTSPSRENRARTCVSVRFLAACWSQLCRGDIIPISMHSTACLNARAALPARSNFLFYEEGMVKSEFFLRKRPFGQQAFTNYAMVWITLGRSTRNFDGQHRFDCSIFVQIIGFLSFANVNWQAS